MWDVLERWGEGNYEATIGQLYHHCQFSAGMDIEWYSHYPDSGPKEKV